MALHARLGVPTCTLLLPVGAETLGASMLTHWLIYSADRKEAL
jgi:hypothetical protein